MAMGIFNWLSGSGNPTKDWPMHGELPAFDINTRSFGPLRFGDNLEAARRVGKPKNCSYLKSPGSWCLEYVSRGYHLCFTADRFVDAFFEIGYGGEFRLKPDSPKAQPLLSNGERLTMNTQVEQVIRLFGEPDRTHEDEGEYEDDGRLLDYPGSPVAMEFEFNTDGKLAYWHLFEPTNPAIS